MLNKWRYQEPACVKIILLCATVYGVIVWVLPPEKARISVVDLPYVG